MDNQLAQFLKIIKQIESSGGKNTNHREIASGIHAGDSAIGDYGLMPNTIQEVLKRKARQKALEQTMEPLRTMQSDKLKAYLENEHPEYQEKIAQDLAQKVLTRSGGDHEKAAYMWNQGHNLDPNQITPEKLNAAGYIQKFRALNGVINKPAPEPPSEAEKAFQERAASYRASPIPVDIIEPVDPAIEAEKELQKRSIVYRKNPIPFDDEDDNS